MKSIGIIIFCAVLVLPAMAFPFSANGAPAYEGGTVFRDAEGKEWVLSEVKSAGKTTVMDRKKLEADSMGTFYTINFSEGKVNGTGAPNRYFAPYTSGSNRVLSIGNIASTMMMAFREPDGLKENEYFAYLSKVTRWDLREGKLELYSSAGAGGEAILIFTPN